MAQWDHYLEIGYGGWGHAGELYPDALRQSPAAVEAVSEPARHAPSLRERLAILMSQRVAELDPIYKIWGATFFAITLIFSAALLAVFVVTR
jgi:hypothetical protein